MSLSINKKVSLFNLILGILFVAIAIITLQLVKKSKTEEAFLKESGKMAQQISELLDKKFDIGLTNAVGFSSRPDVINALSNNDREGAIQALERVGAEYTKQTNYKGIKIHLHDRYGKSFIKNWDTGSFGEDLISSRESVNNVIKDKKATVQFEIGSVGLMIRAISPVFDNELYVGSVEFLQGVGSVSRDLAKKDLIYALVIPNQVAEKYSKLAKNKQVGSFVLANNKWFSDEVVSALGDADMLNLTTNSKFLGKMYYFISIPVKTDSGALIGYHISGCHFAVQLTPPICRSIDPLSP
jgi:methyl-accepting chemotaxis protein